MNMTYSGNQDFVKNAILKDHTIAAEIEKHRWGVFERFPHTPCSEEEYTDFMNCLWSPWVQEKKKNVVHMVNELCQQPQKSNSAAVSNLTYQIRSLKPSSL